MAPSAERLFEGLRTDIAESLAPSEEIETIKQKLQEALANNDFATVSSLSTRVATLTNLKRELLDTGDPFTDILKKYGVDQVDLPIAGSRRKGRSKEKRAVAMEQPVAEPVEETCTESKRKNIYVDDAMPKIILAVIAKGRSGRFESRKISSIISKILRHPQDKTPEIKHRASVYVRVTKSEFGTELKAQAKRLAATSMNDLLQKHFEGKLEKSVKNPEWRKVYETISKVYGKMEPNEFIDKVLNRFRQTKVERALLARRIKEQPKLPKKIPEISPRILKRNNIAELVLCSALLRPGVFEKIRDTLLLGQDLETKLKEKGWKQGPVKEAVQKSLDLICEERNNRPISADEGKKAKKLISAVLVTLQHRRTGWNQLSSEFSGLRLIYFLTPFLKGVSELQKLEDILFPRMQVKVDGEGLVQGISKA